MLFFTSIVPLQLLMSSRLSVIDRDMCKGQTAMKLASFNPLMGLGAQTLLVLFKHKELEDNRNTGFIYNNPSFTP